MRRSLRITCLVAALALVAARPARPAPARLDLSGTTLSAHEGAALLAGALRAPRDSARVRTALGALVARLQSLGYLEARATAAWDSGAAPRLAVDVQQGQRSTIASVVFETPAREDSASFAAALAIQPGEAASPTGIARRVERAVDELSANGHPYAVLGVHGWDADSGAVRLRLSGALGPRVQITNVRIEGLEVTRRDVALRAMGRLTGLPYRRAAAEDARDRLEALGLFRRVTYEGLRGEGDWSRANLVYRVVEPRYNEFEGVVGVQGKAGTVGLLRLELQNLVGTGRSVGLNWESRGSGVSLFGAHAAEPQLLGLPLKLELRLDQDVQDTLYTRTRWGGQGTWALSGRERMEAGIEEERVVSEHAEIEEANLQNTHFAFERGTLQSGFDPRHGTRVRVIGTEIWKRQTLRPSGESRANESAAEMDLAWRHPTGGATGVSLEVRSAGRFSSERILPLFERYPLGGATTLRGYDEDQFRVDRFALTRLEWGRTLAGGGQWAYLFWDHAWTGTRLPTATGDTFQQQSKDGLGFGLQIEAAGGWIGLDYGLAPGLAPLEGKIHVKLLSQF